MFRWIIFLVMIVYQDIDLIFLIALLVVIFSRPWTSHAGVLKIPRVSDEYGVLDVKCKRKWFWDLFLITSVHWFQILDSSRRKFCHLEKLRISWSDGWFCKLRKKIFFSKVFAQSPLSPYVLMANWPDWTVPSRGNGEGGRDEVWDWETMFSQLAKRSPCVFFPQ